MYDSQQAGRLSGRMEGWQMDYYVVTDRAGNVIGEFDCRASALCCLAAYPGGRMRKVTA